MKCDIILSDAMASLSHEARWGYLVANALADVNGVLPGRGIVERMANVGSGAIDELVAAEWLVCVPDKNACAYVIRHWWAMNERARLRAEKHPCRFIVSGHLRFEGDPYDSPYVLPRPGAVLTRDPCVCIHCGGEAVLVKDPRAAYVICDRCGTYYHHDIIGVKNGS